MTIATFAQRLSNFSQILISHPWSKMCLPSRHLIVGLISCSSCLHGPVIDDIETLQQCNHEISNRNGPRRTEDGGRSLRLITAHVTWCLARWEEPYVRFITARPHEDCVTVRSRRYIYSIRASSASTHLLDSIAMGEQGHQALVLGASGITGWAVSPTAMSTPSAPG